MTTDQIAAMKRIRRKAEILRMDLKARNDPKYHDMNEILSLLDIVEKKL